MALFSTKTVQLAITLLALTLLLQLAYWFVPTAPKNAVTLEIASGTSLSRVARQLEELEVVRSATALKLLARLRNQSGAIHAGRYRFEAEANPAEILARLVSGDVIQASLTIPEGLTLQQIADKLEAEHLGKAERFRQLGRDPQILADFEIRADSLEGYLFPETYRFSPGTDEAELLRMMVRQLLDKLDNKLLSAAGQRGLDRHQLVTLASIIEKETGLVEEMPIISSVFHNRLRRKIPLQTDPTVIYGIENFDGNLTRRHLETPTAYNTYLIRGLPPGPIANPGLAALQAAANPTETNYLYFVARGDGSHQFSATLQEHNRAVRRYQLKRRN